MRIGGWFVTGAVILCSCAIDDGASVDGASQGATSVPDPGSPDSPDWVGVRWTDAAGELGVVNFMIDKDGSDTEDCPRLGKKKKNSPYSASLTDAQVEVILAAINEWRHLTPVKFVRYFGTPPASGHYLVFRNGTKTSFADVRGMPTDRRADCVYLRAFFTDAAGNQVPFVNDLNGRRIMVHEIGHALGLDHEMQRKDRDVYVDYKAQCIDRSIAGDLDKLFNKHRGAELLTPYDRFSIMHYASDYPCKASCLDADGVCTTPIIRWKDVTCDTSDPLCGFIGINSQLSVNDVNAMFRMYERPLGVAAPDAALGTSVAVGDFDDDQHLDVAVGAPGQNKVYVWKGTAGAKPGDYGRLVAWNVIGLGDAGAAGAGELGAALATGDFDGDGVTDLAIGAPGGTGAVAVFTSDTPDPYSPRRGLVYRNTYVGTGDGDRFGAAIAVADFDQDGHDDLAIGAPGAHQGSIRTGAVVIAASSAVLPRTLFATDAPGGVAAPGDGFGRALSARNLDLDGAPDLVVGAPADAPATGTVYVFAGGGDGTFVGAPPIAPADGTPGMHFGAALRVADLVGSLAPDLIVGAPDRDYGTATDTSFVLPGAGSIYVYTTLSSAGLDVQPVQRVDDPAPVAHGRFGTSLFASRIRTRPADAPAGELLLVGAPAAGAGTVTVLSWDSTLDLAPAHHPLAPPTDVVDGDRFGLAFAVGNFRPSADGSNGDEEYVITAPGHDLASGVMFVRSSDPAVAQRYHRFRQDSAQPE